MGTVFLIFILVGVVLALVAAAAALRAYIRLRRARVAFQSHVTEEVIHLSRRAGELEENLSALEGRAQRLPVQVSELQQSLATLQVLAEALGASLRQAQKILSYSTLKTLSAERIAHALRTRSAPEHSRPPR